MKLLIPIKKGKVGIVVYKQISYALPFTFHERVIKGSHYNTTETTQALYIYTKVNVNSIGSSRG
jgi:hypothetical protein